MSKEQENQKLKQKLAKYLRNGLVTAALIPAAVVGTRGVENSDLQTVLFPDQQPQNVLTLDKLAEGGNSELDATTRIGVTFLVSAEVLGVWLLGYRFSDGAVNKTEKYCWKYGVPSANMIGATMLLAEMWR